MILNVATTPVAASTSIESLRHDRLLGTLASTSVMRERVQSRGYGLTRAAALLGLTSDEYQAWRSQILNSPSLMYVQLPHHLDGMTGYSARRGVYVIRDVDIPTSYGWEVDLNEPAAHRVLALYLPADCGNLSLLKKPERILAVATARPPLPPPYHEPSPTPAPAVSAVQVTPPPPPPSAPVATAPPVVAVAAVHHGTILPYIGAAVLGGAIYLIVHKCTCPSPPPGYQYASGSCVKVLR